MRGRRGTPGEAEGRETGEGQEDGELEGLRERINERYEEGVGESGQGSHSERSEDASGDRPDGDPQESGAAGNRHASERDLTVEATQSERERQGVERDREADNVTGHEGNLENDEEGQANEELERLREQINEKHEAAEEKDGVPAEDEDSQEVEVESAGSASKEPHSTDVREGAGDDTTDDGDQVPPADADPPEGTQGQALTEQEPNGDASDPTLENQGMEDCGDEKLERLGKRITENQESPEENGHSLGDSEGPEGDSAASPNSEPQSENDTEDKVDQSENGDGEDASDAAKRKERTSYHAEALAEDSTAGNQQTHESISTEPLENHNPNQNEQHDVDPQQDGASDPNAIGHEEELASRLDVDKQTEVHAIRSSDKLEEEHHETEGSLEPISRQISSIEQQGETPAAPNDHFEHDNGMDIEVAVSPETASVKEEANAASPDQEEHRRGFGSVEQTGSGSGGVSESRGEFLSSGAVQANGENEVDALHETLRATLEKQQDLTTSSPNREDLVNGHLKVGEGQTENIHRDDQGFDERHAGSVRQEKQTQADLGEIILSDGRTDSAPYPPMPQVGEQADFERGRGESDPAKTKSQPRENSEMQRAGQGPLGIAREPQDITVAASTMLSRSVYGTESERVLSSSDQGSASVRKSGLEVDGGTDIGQASPTLTERQYPPSPESNSQFGKSERETEKKARIVESAVQQGGTTSEVKRTEDSKGSDSKTVIDKTRQSQERTGQPPSDLGNLSEKVDTITVENSGHTEGKDNSNLRNGAISHLELLTEKLMRTTEESENHVAVVYSKPHLKPGEHPSIDFLLPISQLEKQTGKTLGVGMMFKVKGEIEGVCRYETYGLRRNSPYYHIFVSKPYHEKVRVGEKHKITVSSVEEKKITKAGSEILASMKHGQNWRSITSQIERSSEKTEPRGAESGRASEKPRVERKPLDERLNEWRGKSDVRWKMYLGRWIERELSRARSESESTGAVKRVEKTSVHVTNGFGKERMLKGKLVEGSHVALSDGVDRASQSGGSKSDRGTDELRTSAGASEGTHTSSMTGEQFEKERPMTWEWLSGFFDGEGTIRVEVRKQSIRFEVSISQKYKPQLESIASFLRKEGLHNPMVVRTDPKVYRISTNSNEDVRHILHGIEPFLRLKKRQANATLDYLEDKISGGDLVRIVNEEVEAGRRSGYLRDVPHQPLTRTESIRRARRTTGKGAYKTLYRPLERLDEAREG